MKRTSTFTLSLTFLLCSFGSNLFADIVDQQQLNWTTGLGPEAGYFHNIQSFTQTQNSNITGASAAILNVPIGTTITIRVFNSLTGISDPTNAIGTGSFVTTSTSSTQSQFAKVSFIGGAGQPANPIPVNIGQTLYLGFEKSTGSGAFLGALTDEYSNGHVYSNGTAFSDYDFAFETFSSVPEPSSFAIVGFGITFVALRRRRYSSIRL